MHNRLLRLKAETCTGIPEGDFARIDYDEKDGIMVIVDGVRMTIEEFQRP